MYILGIDNKILSAYTILLLAAEQIKKEGFIDGKTEITGSGT